jgi:hypothetical protein
MDGCDVGPHRARPGAVRLFLCLRRRLTRSINHRLERHMKPKLYRLGAFQQRLDSEIRRELKRPVPSALRLLRLKMLRLGLQARLHRHAPLAI